MKILIVEDDPSIAQTLALLISSYNYAVDTASDGELGLQMAETLEYDLIVLDMGLPKLDGISLCQQLRSQRLQTPILLLTGQGEGRQKAIALNAGADDYVVKPFDADELMARVQALLRRGNSTHQPILSWGDLSLDPSRRHVAYGSHVLNLTPKEYAILELMLRNAQAVLSARAILDHAWTDAEFPGEEAVRVHIKELRQKLRTAGAPDKWIKTVHGVGYQLNPLYSFQSIELPTLSQIAELQSINEELRASLEKSQITEAELRQQNAELLAQQTIEQDRNDYRELFEQSPYSYLITDLNGKIQAANQSAIALFADEQLVGKSLVDFVLASEQLNELEQDDFELILNRQNAEPCRVRVSVRPLRDTQHQINRLHWIVQESRKSLGQHRVDRLRLEDNRQLAELALQQQIRQEYLLAETAQEIRQSLMMDEVLSRTVERVRDILKTDRVAIFRFQPDWSGEAIMESVGEGWLSILSTTVFDSCFRDRYIEPYRQGRISAVADTQHSDLEPCYVEFLETMQVKANLVVPILQGEHLWGLLIAHHCAAPRQWLPGEIVLLQRLATQVSIAIQQAELYQQLQTELDDHEQAEQVIREQAALLEITSDAICVCDLDQRILYWNQGAERLYGWQAAEAIGQKVDELLQDDSTQTLEIMTMLLEQGEWRGEVRKTTRSGASVIVEERYTLVRDEAGQPKSIFSVATDLTEKKSLEAQFYHAQRLESLGTLASGIAHDLNNVLTPILTISQLLNRDSMDQSRRSQMLHAVEDSARRGTHLVKQILTSVRGTEGRRVPIQILDLLQEIITVVRQTFPKSIALHQDPLSDEIGLISADPTQIHQVLMNLCVNARDAMPQGGVLTIAVQNCIVDQRFAQLNLAAKVGRYVLITIADTGIGIPPEIRDRIFDPFFTTKPIGQGSGLGLSTALGIIRSHHGFMQVFSAVGQGTQFSVYLPITTEALTEHELTAAALQGNGELVLLVEDDPAVQYANRSLLESHRYQVVVANDGLEAITLYTQHREAIRVVLMDVMMPNLDGTGTIRTLKRMNPDVKIIAMSGLASNQEAVLAAGATRFLPKPYALDELLQRVADLIHGLE